MLQNFTCFLLARESRVNNTCCRLFSADVNKLTARKVIQSGGLFESCVLSFDFVTKIPNSF